MKPLSDLWRARLLRWLVCSWPLALGCGGLPPSSAARCTTDASCPASTLRCEAGSCVPAQCPADTHFVPGGVYTQGCSPGDIDCAPVAQPAHPVTLTRGFCLAATELTVGQYRACLSSGQCPPPAAPETLDSLRCTSDLATWQATPGPADALPMSCLLFAEARAACTALGGRLPSEAEWERAARGSDSRAFPWGKTPPISCDQGVNFAGFGCPLHPWPGARTDGGASASGGMQASPYGPLDLSGNLSEWVADAYDPGAYARCVSGCSDPMVETPIGSDAGLRVRRGGSFLSRISELRTTTREFHAALGPRSDLVGVRCAYASK